MQSRHVSGALASRAKVTLELSPTWVYGDRARLEQIFSNLLENALKFTPPDGTIRVSLHQQVDEAVLRISDSGRGIAAHVIPTVFEPFVQGAQNLDRPEGGLGLGLALVKRFAELHGGSVNAESRGVGLGATFTVRLPAIATPGEQQPAAPKSEHHTGPLLVLVIEDNQDARRMLRVRLALQGHQVREAANGAAGIRAAMEMKPDVVVLDIGLPDMDGYGVARRLRATPGGRSLILVALSGYGQDDDRAAGAGFDAYLVKPANPEQLTQTIAELMARNRGMAK